MKCAGCGIGIIGTPHTTRISEGTDWHDECNERDLRFKAQAALADAQERIAELEALVSKPGDKVVAKLEQMLKEVHSEEMTTITEDLDLLVAAARRESGPTWQVIKDVKRIKERVVKRVEALETALAKG